MVELADNVGKTTGNLSNILTHNKFTVDMLIDLLEGLNEGLVIRIDKRYFKIVKND